MDTNEMVKAASAALRKIRKSGGSLDDIKARLEAWAAVNLSSLPVESREMVAARAIKRAGL